MLLALLMGLLLESAWSTEPDCGALLERAVEVRELRDRDANAGVEAGHRLLDELRGPVPECPAARALTHAALAANLHILGRMDGALESVSDALAGLERVDDPVQRATVHRTAGVVFWEVEVHDRALSHYQRALEYSRDAGDAVSIGRTAGNIGNLHTTLGNFDDAERYHREALSAFESSNFRQGVAGTLVNLGALALRRAVNLDEQGRSQAAIDAHRSNLDYNRRALGLFEQIGNPRGIAYAADNVARALVSLKRPEEALPVHQRSLQLRRQVGDRLGGVQSLLTGAAIHRAMDRPEIALGLLDQALQELSDDNTALRRRTIERQIELLVDLRRWREAFERQSTLMAMQEAAVIEEITARTEEIETRYRADQLQRQLDLQRTRTQVSEQRAERQRLISLASIVTVVLLMVIVVLLFNRYRLGQQVSRSLDRAARTDPLTGLANRRDMTEQIDQAIARCRDAGESAALVMADIDSFKRINDTLGHQQGDRVLIHVAGLLRDQVRGKDWISRWGGEEFLLLLSDTGLNGAVKVCENLRRALNSSPPVVADRPLTLTMTFGVAELARTMDLNDALKTVDAALYRGKAGGKDRVVTSAGTEP